jgi:hypothetical protein
VRLAGREQIAVRRSDLHAIPAVETRPGTIGIIVDYGPVVDIGDAHIRDVGYRSVVVEIVIPPIAAHEA